MPNLLQEKLLLYQLQHKKDSDAFAKIYDAYVQRIYRFVYFKVASAEEAQDITSDVFLKFWQYIRDGKKVTHIGALLYLMARQHVADHYQARAKAQTDVSIDADESHLQLPDIAGLARIVRSAELSQVLTALRLLKEEYREVLIMRYIDGMSAPEIAEVLEKSAGAVRVLLHRALEAVKALLSPQKNDSV